MIIGPLAVVLACVLLSDPSTITRTNGGKLTAPVLADAKHARGGDGLRVAIKT